LLQQILLDVVSVFNMVSSLSQEKQSVKITQEGLEVGHILIFSAYTLGKNIFLGVPSLIF